MRNFGRKGGGGGGGGVRTPPGSSHGMGKGLTPLTLWMDET